MEIFQFSNIFNILIFLSAGIRNEWNSLAINDLADSYYQEWTYEDRKLLEYTCQAGFLFSVVVVQWACAVQARSRRLSVLQVLFCTTP